uniref:Mutator-like transposase n=1 Tax=Arabidopsis thaliana TaxID=3702 RepID=O64830_ARATH|nr:Mutator-like transposase [Arabidopsis thaliana]
MKKKIHTKTSSLEKISYSMLVDKIMKKVAIDEASVKLKLSYNLSKVRRETYIVDDEDVFIFLTESDEESRIPVLHVEELNGIGVERREEISVPERRSSVGVNVIEDDVLNEVCEMVHDGYDNDVNDCENVVGTEIVAVERPMERPVNSVEEEDEDDRIDYDDIHDIPRSVEVTPQVIEWDDGTGIEIGQEFCSREAVWELVNRAAKKEVFGVYTIKSDPLRLMLRCRQASKGCTWYLRVARTKKSHFWSVRVHRKMHTCSRSVETTSNSIQRGTPRLIASVLHCDYPGNLETPTPKNIMSIVRGRLGVHCSYSTALRGKMLHVSDVRGTPERSYTMLFSYLYMLEKVNPGTVTYVELEGEKKFKYLFIALGACIEGFRAMRKVIVVDATHLKTVYGGMLVIATAQDPNIIIIHLRLESLIARRIDRHQSIKKAVKTVYPNALHAACIWHLCQNMRDRVKIDKDRAAVKFRDCAHAYTESEFEKEFGHFTSLWPKAADFLVKVGFEKWSKCHFKGDKYNIDTSNSAESINGVFKKARKYHLLPMIDVMISKFSEWFNEHRQASGSCPITAQVVPTVENILHIRCQVVAKLTVFELNSYNQEYNVIDLNSIVGHWPITGRYRPQSSSARLQALPITVTISSPSCQQPRCPIVTLNHPRPKLVGIVERRMPMQIGGFQKNVFVDEEYESRNHLIQWWDQAVTEELEKVNHKLDSTLRHGQLACNHALESIRETIQLMQGEIETLKESYVYENVDTRITARRGVGRAD